MRIWLFIFTLFLWGILLLINMENNIPSDGVAFIGFPKAFLEIVQNPITGKYVKIFNYLGIILNILVIGVIYLGISLLRRKLKPFQKEN